MAITFLSANETTYIAGNDTEVFGQAGEESVTLIDGFTGFVLDQNIEGVSFEGNRADYTFEQQGINLLVKKSLHDVVATISVQSDEDGTQLTFADGIVGAVFGESNNIVIGNAPDSVVAVSEATAGAPLDAGGGDVVFEIQAGEYTQQIINFRAGDVLDFPDANTPTLIQTDFTDGVVGVQYAVSKAEKMIVELTGLDPAIDTQLLGVTDLNTVFGQGTIGDVDNGGDDDYAGTTATNGQLIINGSVTGNLETTGDRDWFAVTLDSSHNYDIDLEGSSINQDSLADPYLYLRDANGTLVASNDDGGTGLNSRLDDYSPSTSGTFYVDVGGYDDNSTGYYRVSVTDLGEDQRYEDIFNFTDSEMNVATRLTLEPAPEYSWDRGETHVDSHGSADGDVFVISLIEDYSYDIMTLSFFEPYDFFGIGDSNGIMLDMESESMSNFINFDGIGHNARILRDFEAPYTGDYYIQAGWAPGSYYDTTAIAVYEYAPNLTLMGVEQSTADYTVTVG